MTEKTEALRLAEVSPYLEGGERGQWIINAAAELRRLHQFAEDQIGRATAAEAALQMTKATHALKIAAVEAQRDALLEALIRCRNRFFPSDQPERDRDELWEPVNAAIKAVEGESHAKSL